MSSTPHRMRAVANLGTLFTDVGLFERYERAAAAGFKAVEIPNPYTEKAECLRKRADRLGLAHVLINAPAGPAEYGGKGIAAVPKARNLFEESIRTAIHYAKTLSCPRIHIMAGMAEAGNSEAKQIYRSNIGLAAELAAEEDILCLIEPINSYTIPGYFLNSYDQAVQVLEDLGKKPNLKLMFDVFHAQQICGQLTATVRQLRHYIGHIQIAQVPARGPPDSPGEIDYHYVFQMLKDELNHLSNIGCEYNYNGENFDWVSRLGLEF